MINLRLEFDSALGAFFFFFLNERAQNCAYYIDKRRRVTGKPITKDYSREIIETKSFFKCMFLP